MPKKLSDNLNERIVTEIARHSAGVGIDELHGILAELVSRRTLQRRLGDMVAAQTLVTTGKGRSLLYHSQQQQAQSEAEPTPPQPQTVITYRPTAPLRIAEDVGAESYVSVSLDGQEVLDYVRQPIQYRKPVGYERDFLETYRPNVTRYLTPEIVAHLHHIGRASEQVQPAGTYARDMLGRLLIDLSWASSRLEGNTYTRLDTQNLIEQGREAQGKNRIEAQMILNHKAAIELLVEEAENIGFNTFTFFNLHALLSENLLADPSESGRVRQRIVDISGTVFHPLGIPKQLSNYLSQILDKAEAIEEPFEQAFFIMVHVPYLQPFVDVNKRVSRLGANIPLIRHNLCPLSFIDVPDRAYVEGTLGVYEMCRVELLRDVFVWAYERSCQRYIAIRATVADPDPLRLRLRETIVTLVAEVVRGLQVPDAAAVRTLATSLVAPADVEPIVQLVMTDLANLHEGNVTRYRLRLAEYRNWQPMQSSQ